MGFSSQNTCVQLRVCAAVCARTHIEYGIFFTVYTFLGMRLGSVYVVYEICCLSPYLANEPAQPVRLATV